MSEVFVLRRGRVVTALVTAVILASCSESAVTPGTENYASGTPRATLSAEFNQYQFLGYVLDDAGANDTPAQSDLNAFTRADNVSGKVGVKWVWDDVNSWTGSGQTGDACALFDTTPSNSNKGKGTANFAVCVRINNPLGDPTQVGQLAAPASPLLYSCGDTKNDRCASQSKLLQLNGIICEVQKINGETFFTAGEDGADVEAACSIPLSAISATSAPNLLNVCSYPSGSPGSNPFDCVVTPGAGFFVIKKATTPQNSGLTFRFGISPAPVGGDSATIIDNTTGVEQTSLISAAPGTKFYSVGEGTLPAGWSLNAASCAFDRAGSPATGTKIGSHVDSVSIESGETTVCTFDNRVVAPSIAVVKTASPNSIPETGDSVGYTVAVTNNASIPVTLDSLTDDVFGNLDGLGTCNHTGNLFGSIAAGGSYSCVFKRLLAPANAGSTHINTARAKVSSDGGPASATDTALVTYTDVLPDITVSKSADDTTITASGGLEVSGFDPDQTFLTSGTGGGGGSLSFANDICDDAGPNDQPAQSDLNCFSRADNISGRLGVKWTWDDINSWTGSGQTGDACALLDTNHDGNANFAFCGRITNPNGDPTQIVQVAGSPILYKCADKAADKCASKNSVQVLSSSSVCTITIASEHFPGQGDDGSDVQAECNLSLADLSPTATNANVSLLNVCSYPSGSPGSNAFDCVVTPAAGFLVLVESTTPSSSSAVFGFTLANGTNTGVGTATNGDDAFGVKAGVTSSGIPMVAGSYSITQLMPSSWTLSGIVCNQGGSAVGTTSGQVKLNVTIVSGQTTTCTFSNVLTASQTITFTVTVTNNSKEAVSLFSLEDTENPSAVTPTYTTLNGVNTCATGGTIIKGTPYTCTFTRTVSGSPGTTHNDKVRAVGHDDDGNADTDISSVVTVTIH